MADIKNIQVDGVDYAIKDESARNSIGDLSQLATEAKGDLVSALNELSAGAGSGSGPIQRIESLDESNLLNLRDLETGSYVLYGYFRPFPGASNYLPFDNLLVNVYHVDEGSHLFEFSTANSEVNFIEILVDASAEGGHTYSRTAINMLELSGLIGKLGNLNDLTTTEKGTVVGAINEVAAVQPDLSQNDPEQPDYVKNRTHWEEANLSELYAIENCAFSANGGLYMAEIRIDDLDAVVVAGNEYVVKWDGNEYRVTAVDYMDGAAVLLGNASIPNAGDDTGEPFVMQITSYAIVVATLETAASHSVGIYEGSTIVHKLDPKFLPEGGFGWEEGETTVIRVSTDAVMDTMEMDGQPIYHRVSDATPTWDDLTGAVMEVSVDNGAYHETILLTEELLSEGKAESTESVMFVYAGGLAMFVVCEENGEFDGFTFSSKGFYCTEQDLNNRMSATITYGEYEIHKIDEKFLPNDAEAIMVKITPNEEGNPVASHTREQILAAINDGKIVACYAENGDDNGKWIMGTNECKVTEAGAEFTLRYVDGNADFSPVLREETFIIDNEGNVTYTNDEFILEWCPPADAVADAAGETPTAAEFNALLASLRTAGFLKS